jgi:predicted MFS family arabinose efflux permease
MVDVLGFSKIQLGWLATLASAGAIVGAALFGRYFKAIPIRRLLNLAVAIGVAGTLAYYGLVGWWSAVVLNVTVSLVSMIALLATLDLAARAIPTRAEGTFFAALMSVDNVGTAGAEWLGGQLYDLVGLNWLIALSAATTAACWLLVPWVRGDTEPARAEAGSGTC